MASFSPDDKLIIITTTGNISANGPSLPTNATLWDFETGTVIYTLQHDDPVFDAIFSPNGSFICTYTSNRWNTKNITIWNTSSGEYIKQVMNDNFKIQRFNNQTFKPFSFDEKYFISVSNNVAKVWDTASGDLVFVVGGKENPYTVHDAQFLPNGNIITVLNPNIVGSDSDSESELVSSYGSEKVSNTLIINIWSKVTELK